MKYLTVIFVLLCLFGSISANARVLMVEDFSQYKVGDLPSSWRTWPFQRGKAEEVYKVKEENGKKFLSAYDSKDYSVQILKNFYWKIKSYPKLSWKWRAQVLPAGANETNPNTNDSSCGVYVVLSRARGEMIKYTWSSTQPIGTVYEKQKDKAYIIVADTGPSKLGKWQSHTVNVPEEYKKYFHKDLDKEPVAIAILTDGNAMHTASSCDYADFTIGE